MTNLNPDDVEQYPLIEVANPNAGAQGKSATMMVFRTWTVNDVKAACEGIPGPEVYAAAFKQGVQGLHGSPGKCGIGAFPSTCLKSTPCGIRTPVADEHDVPVPCETSELHGHCPLTTSSYD